MNKLQLNRSSEIPDKVNTNRERVHRLRINRVSCNKSNLGPDFVAPDGGWGWIICLACGFSTLLMQAPLQQYGLLYRQRLFNLGFDAKQIISIVNTQMAAAKLTGLIHGPLYRRVTFRKASVLGSVLIFLGIASTAFCINFMQFVLFFSIFYGFGMGINISAVTLALNTYFKIYRRRAMGLAVTLTGLGPIVFPHLVTNLLNNFGQKGAILITAALTLNCLICGCTLQPVLWHVRIEKPIQITSDEEKLKESSMGGNDTQINGNEINVEIETEQMGLQISNEEENEKIRHNKENAFKRCPLEDKAITEQTLLTRLIKFFDLDLLRDLTFLNLIQGLSVMMLGELNFSVLTPFILDGFNYTNEQISLIMSFLAVVDIMVRLTAPLLLEKVKLSNRVLFAFGIIVISIGRFLVTLNNSYFIMLATFLLIGFGKAFRTVFSAMIIPSYVPLNRLPAAAGLQSVFDVLFSFLFGPLLGMFVDASNYTIAIHIINGTSAFSLLLWFTEWLVRRNRSNISNRGI